MTKEEMFQFMVEEVRKQKNWELSYKEIYLMEKSFLMGIDYQKRLVGNHINNIYQQD